MSATPWRIPARIETERLVVRRYEPSDAEQMSAVTAANKEHLLPWLPWAADEPLDAESRAKLIAMFMAEFDEGKEFAMGIFTRDGHYLGGTGFHTRRGPGVLEIGYWLAADAQGQGFMTEAVGALTVVAIEFSGAERVEINHHPDNSRSSRVPERIGFTYEGDQVVSLDGVGELEPWSVWAVAAPELEETTLASAARPAIFDASGAPLPWGAAG